MVRVTSGAFHEKLSAGNEEIILNGPPGDLRGHILVSNHNNDTLKVKSLPLSQDQQLRGTAGMDASLNLSCRLHPGEAKMVEVWHQVDSFTAPGEYENTIMVGGEQRKVKIIVQGVIEIDIHPRHFVFTGTNAGTRHTAVFMLSNLGNIPFQVPDVKHIAALDMDLICRAFGMGMRIGGAGGAMSALDEVAKNMHANLPDWANAEIEENGQVLEPGAKQMIHLQITMPKNSDGKKDYGGNVRFWDQELTYMVKAQ
ncbi:hypothetical protein LZZ85_03920 [Terrimonas sp. NA20]|uniref:Uncharacterized protein n=1 Tax=Terrimonas ginsenosidimutans TaxID=2908004 RepID=A0ABS9KM73_9BACT|nr:hypothetical protein [Terrimonas ginsenosidimutans]MCG2613409.1 hypothetical protein [Terrimonas ginsenosidimutans]